MITIAKQIGDCPAFPDQTTGREGMTYRQWLAGMAMQGLCAYSQPMGLKEIATSALGAADALLEKLAEEMNK